MKVYPQHQESGLGWIGEIPSHWHLERIKFSLTEIAKRSDDNLSAGAISFGKVVTKDADGIPVETRSTYQVVRKGEYLINPINLNYDLKSLRTALSGVNVCVSPAYIVLQANADKLDPAFGAYALHLFDVRHMKTLGAGVRQTITFRDIGRCFWALPPRDEQIAIAAFLDHETGKIDRLIAEQERLIGLLDEKRQAVISHAVTKGIDPEVEMKDSGIEWMGEVPAHWQLKAVKSLARIKGGSTPDATEGHWDGDVVWYSPSDLTGDTSIYASSSARTITAAGAQSCSTNITPAGSVVLSTRAPIGSVKISSVESCTNQGCKTLVPVETSAEHLYYVLLSATKELNLRGRGTTFLEISGDALGSLVIPVPPKEDRDIIVETLSHEMGVMRTLQDESRVMLSLLKERRSALISAAVTGKIDVRNHPAAVAPLNENKD